MAKVERLEEEEDAEEVAEGVAEGADDDEEKPDNPTASACEAKKSRMDVTVMHPDTLPSASMQNRRRDDVTAMRCMQTPKVSFRLHVC